MHYLMGGIKVNARGETKIPGLYAAGEAQAGIHGGNRLGSVALSEIFTFGCLVGEAAAKYAAENRVAGTGDLGDKLEKWQQILRGDGKNWPQALKKGLQQAMWEGAGPLRHEEGLLKVLNQLGLLEKAATSLYLKKDGTLSRQILDAIELIQMLFVAKAIVLSALQRRESRGAHLRSDYPYRDDQHYLAHTAVTMERDESIKCFLEPPGHLSPC